MRGGLPPGLLTVLPEAPQAVSEAIAAGVDQVVLTGSPETGAEVLGQLAPRCVPAVLELSGNDPLIALDDADADLVVRALLFGLRLHGGETCIAPRRALIHRALFPAVEAGLATALRVPAQGAMAEGGRGASSSPSQIHARELVAAAVAGGARLVGGSASGAELGARGPAVPLVVAGAPPDAELRRADLFAPVVLLDAVDGEEEAVRLANGGPWALGASIFGGEGRARALAARLVAGVVTINDVVVPTADPRLPFGGRRRSGFGVTRGAEGLLAMTAVKAVAVRRRARLPRLQRGHRHLDPPRRSDEALFGAYLAAAHRPTLLGRLRALPALARALAGRWGEERDERLRGGVTAPVADHPAADSARLGESR